MPRDWRHPSCAQAGSFKLWEVSPIGGKPKTSTPADKRLSENKIKTAPKPKKPTK